MATEEQQKAELKYLYSLLNLRSLVNFSLELLVAVTILLQVVKVIKLQ